MVSGWLGVVGVVMRAWRRAPDTARTFLPVCGWFTRRGMLPLSGRELCCRGSWLEVSVQVARLLEGKDRDVGGGWSFV